VSTFHRLLNEHGAAADALAALPDVARAAGVDDYAPCPEGVIHNEIKMGRAAGARLVCRGDDDYPAELLSVSDAPPLFWAVGDLGLLSRPAIAVIGARNASSLGGRMARKLATDLSVAGHVVVSGLARGIDAIAHDAALSAGTIAVLAGGVDVAYPQENRKLFDAIGQSGLRISEQAMGLQPQARHFPIRNRIISGLCKAVVVVEAAAKSGSLITAEIALGQGRDVFAVPGHPFDGRAAGCNNLIRDGATLIRHADDVLEALNTADRSAPELPLSPPKAADKPKRSLRTTAALHRQILTRLGPSPLAEDQLIRDLKVTAPEASPAILELELSGKIQRQPGGLLSKT
jgi:DNA processing protein